GASALLHQGRGIGMPGTTLHRTLFAASLVALATAVLWLCITTVQMSGGLALDDLTLVVMKTTFGNVFLIRLALLLLLCVLAVAANAAVGTVTAGAALALLAVTSHAAAARPQMGTITDAFHLLTGGFWVGGLVVLVPEVLAKPRDTVRLIALLK